MKFSQKNLEILGLILIFLLLVFRPRFIKDFSDNLFGKFIILILIVLVSAHNKAFGLLAALTFIVCLELYLEGAEFDENSPKECPIWIKKNSKKNSEKKDICSIIFANPATDPDSDTDNGTQLNKSLFFALLLVSAFSSVVSSWGVAS